MSRVIGDHEFSQANVVVFPFSFGGASFVAAVRIADKVVINSLPLTGANATLVILSGLGALTGGRNWKETIAVKGNYTDLSRITIPSYTVLEIQGKLKAVANLNQHFIYSIDTTQVEIYGSEIDGNGANQTANMDTVYFGAVTDSSIHDCRLGGARRVTIDGETIELNGCSRVDIIRNSFYTATWGYDSIKVRQNSRYCIISNNIIDETNGGTSCGIQLSSTTNGYNVVIGNVIYGAGGTGSERNGIKMHDTDKNLIIGNQIYNVPHTGIDVIGDSNGNLIIGNYIYVTDDLAGLSVRATDTETAADNVFDGNYVVLPNVVGAVGIDLWANSVRTRVVRNTVIGGTAADTGINVRADATDNYIAENDLSDANLNTKVTDAGTNTIIKLNRGYVTDNVAISAEVAIDVTGIFGIDVPHGCSRTPEPYEVQATIVKGSTAWAAGFIAFISGIGSTDAVNINVRFRVSTAGSAGQTARIAVQIQSRGN